MTAMTSLHLLAVLDVLSSTPVRAKRRAPFSSARLAPRPDGPLTHFTSPRGEKSRLDSRGQVMDYSKRRSTEPEPRHAFPAESEYAGVKDAVFK